jgi:hypothetical protein
VITVVPPVPVQATARFPVRHEIDGDFTLAELLNLADTATSPPFPGSQPHVAETALRAQLWRPSAKPDPTAVMAASTRSSAADSSTASNRSVTAVDLELMHAFETAPCGRHLLLPGPGQ